MSSVKRRRKHRRRIRPLRILFLLAIAALAVFGVMYMRYKSNLKPVSDVPETVLFEVKAGSSVKDVANDLEAAGLVRDADSAYLFARRNDLGNIKSGEYELDKSWDPEKIFTWISDASNAIVYDTTVTIVEGDWAKDMANKIANATSVTADELMNLWNDETYLRSLMGRYPFITEDLFNRDIRTKLEGYLAPNTYRFYQETTAEEITEKILDQSLKVYNELEADMKKSSLSINEIYTLASIVQFESGDVNEMANISGVFWNRLDIDMPLQSSATVCYAIDFDKGDHWMDCEVNGNYESPYNTYKYGGLPPGPILNPGYDAIYATLHPAKHKYYYFMADVYGTGQIYYAETLAEHEANVSKYLR